MKSFAKPLVLLSTLLLFGSTLTAFAPAPERDRSPIDLALSADGRYALTANATSDTVSLVDVAAGRLLAEAAVGKRPFAVALSRDGRRAVVSNQYADSVSVLEVGPSSLRVERTIPVGDEPRGVALSRDGATAFVALSGEDQVAFVDVAAGKVTGKLDVGAEPWHVAVTPDGARLVVGNSRSRDVSVIDIAARKLAYTVRLRGTNVRHIAISPDGQWAYLPHTSERGRPTTKQFIALGWVIGSRLSRCPLKEEGPREALALDKQGDAVGDVDGAAISPDGATVALTAGGTHELLLLRLPLPFIAYGGPGDTVEKELLDNPDRYRRIRLEGRPMGVAFAPDGRTLVVANYLANTLQVVDANSGQLTRTIPLGGPATPSIERRGEAIFLDADRSFNHWYSCNSCHVEGHTNGSTFDTYNDGSYNTPKKTLSLRGVTQTGPWTWHGWQKDLRQLVHDSMYKTLEGPEPTDAELDAVLAYLKTLDFKANPHRNADGSLPPAALRGEAVFNAKGCNTCHAPPNYTTPAAYVVGLESPLDVYKGFNPPTLRGVYNRAPYLHMGQASTLREVLTRYHQASKLTNKPDPTPQELDDLIAFLRSL
jgi:YVTN family beta-propeller protein